MITNEPTILNAIDRIGMIEYLKERNVSDNTTMADGIEIASPRIKSCSKPSSIPWVTNQFPVTDAFSLVVLALLNSACSPVRAVGGVRAVLSERMRTSADW